MSPLPAQSLSRPSWQKAAFRGRKDASAWASSAVGSVGRKGWAFRVPQVKSEAAQRLGGGSSAQSETAARASLERPAQQSGAAMQSTTKSPSWSHAAGNVRSLICTFVRPETWVTAAPKAWGKAQPQSGAMGDTVLQVAVSAQLTT